MARYFCDLLAKDVRRCLLLGIYVLRRIGQLFTIVIDILFTISQERACSYAGVVNIIFKYNTSLVDEMTVTLS